MSMQTADFKTVTTKYWPDTETLESITTEPIGSLEGRKAKNLTAAIQRRSTISKALCCVIIPSTVIGIALVIAAIVVLNLRSDSNGTLQPALFAPISICFGLAAGLSMIYYTRKDEPITLDTEIITV